MNKQKMKIGDQQGAEASFKFRGSGILLTGSWDSNGEKADINIDGQLMQTIDTYYGLPIVVIQELIYITF